MNLVVPVEFEMADKTKRQIRATNGARRRIANHFGESDLQKILSEKGDGALGEVAYLMMFDADGNPPNVSMARFTEALPWSDGTKLLALILAAFSQGQTSPNEMEAQLLAVQELSQKVETNTGLSTEPSAGSASDSPMPNSGMDSSNAKSIPLETPTESVSEAALA